MSLKTCNSGSRELSASVLNMFQCFDGKNSFHLQGECLWTDKMTIEVKWDVRNVIRRTEDRGAIQWERPSNSEEILMK